MSNDFTKRKNIRNNIRKLRNGLSFNEQKIASLNLYKRILNYNIINNVKYVAIFFSFDGEINTFPLITQMLNKNINVYLPVIDPYHLRNLLFIKYNHTTQLVLNKFNIFEPKIIYRDIIDINQLDIIFVPLVAFNNLGYRLGMGGGFYDKILQNCKDTIVPIGLAYDFQFISFFPVYSWDILLPIIFTPTKIWNNDYLIK
ncbi:5-formyltetrahydrofolate cyclo-ligase [Buchnera aphidicola (Formosaphis micheliae)]|uniref:5-formyltetrahydrofolate cyclo-ligase n=1 Tax=Buchnera aphidicola TaxID=9 RepID=UPI0031CC7DDE